jgi:hypothetical protein
MISRTAAFTSIVLILVMIAATLWRLPMLPDWAYGPNGAPPPMRKPSVMFVIPACVGFVGAVLALRKWLTTASADAVEPWQRWGSHVLVAYAVFCTLFHLYGVARSAGFAGSFSPALVARTVDVLVGCLLIVAANRMPKLPLLPTRFRFGQLDPVRGAQLLRLVAWLLVLSGLAIVIGALVMPLRMMLPLALSVTTTLALAVVVRKVQLLREQSHERLGRGS